MSASTNFRPKTNLIVWVIFGNCGWAENFYFFPFSSLQSERTFKYKLQLQQQSLEEPPTYLSKRVKFRESTTSAGHTTVGS